MIVHFCTRHKERFKCKAQDEEDTGYKVIKGGGRRIGKGKIKSGRNGKNDKAKGILPRLEVGE